MAQSVRSLLRFVKFRASTPAQKELPMTKFVTKFMKDESGATAIEYGLIVALIAVVIITAVTTLGTKLDGTFTTINGKLP